MAENPGSNRNRPNYLYALVSVALVLFLLGFFVTMLIYGQQLIRIFKERVNILVELQEEATPAEISEIQEMLRQARFTKPGSVTYIDREEAAGIMKDELGEDFFKLGLPNPFFDIVSFNVKSAYLQPDSLRQIRTDLRTRSYVSDVFYQESLIDEVAANLRKLGYLGLGLGVFFIVVAVTLIHNTIRLALYANRFLIKNMQLVGASWSYISRPYLWRSVGLGVLSSIIAIGALFGLWLYLKTYLSELEQLLHPKFLIPIFSFLMLLGILINLLSTYYVVNKYLRMRVDDLY